MTDCSPRVQYLKMKREMGLVSSLPRPFESTTRDWLVLEGFNVLEAGPVYEQDPDTLYPQLHQHTAHVWWFDVPDKDGQNITVFQCANCGKLLSWTSKEMKNVKGLTND